MTKNIIYAAAADACVTHNTDAPVIAIEIGERGYHPIFTQVSVEQLNPPNVTPEIIEAAVIGSMFGWRVPGARAAIRYFDGLPS